MTDVVADIFKMKADECSLCLAWRTACGVPTRCVVGFRSSTVVLLVEQGRPVVEHQVPGPV
jgi:hypothetical protein